MNKDEIRLFVYKQRELIPYKREELIIECLEKAEWLLTQELDIDQMYAQMDYGTMGNRQRVIYSNAIEKIKETVKELKR